MKSDPNWAFVIGGAIAGVWVVKYLFFPPRCPRCRSRTYTQYDEISQHNIQRCRKCGSMNDLGEAPRESRRHRSP